MPDEELHIPDQDLLRAADAELPGGRARQIRAHLASCWLCRARLAEIESTIADFVRVHRGTLDPQLPPAAGPRALLKLRLAEAAAKPGASVWPKLLQFFSPRRSVAYVSAVLLLIAAGTALVIQHFAPLPSSPLSPPFVQLESAVVPNPILTPGATRAVSINEVCSAAHEEVVREVAASLRQQVFHEYGIANARAEDYEIDFLIAPRLGGVEDIHNLWPEPYTVPTWNAHVKDALEEHLHQMVCQGTLDLRTAQRDISTDWIAAYKKYFRTETPLATSAADDFNPAHPALSPPRLLTKGSAPAPEVRHNLAQTGRSGNNRKCVPSAVGATQASYVSAGASQLPFQAAISSLAVGSAGVPPALLSSNL